MMFVIKFDVVDNDAFACGNREAEIVRILENTTEKIKDGKINFNILDVNGNTVGRCSFVKS